MSITEGVLIAVVIILTVLIFRNMQANKNAPSNGNVSLATVGNNGSLTNGSVVTIPNANGNVMTAGNINANVAPATSEGMSSMNGQVNYEKAAQEKLRENTEYFAVCGSGNQASEVLDCVCGDQPDVSFAKFDYGAPNMDYKEYVGSQAVDDKVIENHLQFVRDRKGLGPEGEFITGRTYSPDSHDSYDPTPWMGIRGRPQYVQQCNPTQVPDVDTNLYKGHRPYCFWT